MDVRDQRGQVLFAVLLLLVAGTGTLVFHMANPSQLQRSSDEKTTAALAQAKEALIGLNLNDNNRPGTLPCPDTNNDGTAEGMSGNACPSYIGRLPWKSLGLPDLRDGHGERLWYALSPNFRNNAVVEPINTDTKGTTVVYSGTTGTIMTSEAAAVIFAPGPLIASQNRSSSTTGACAAPAGTIAQSHCAANYLETADITNNAMPAGPYIAAKSTTSFNDRLLIVTAADVMIPVEKRAAREILSLLQGYKTATALACNCYPWADNSTGASSTGNHVGRVPLLGALPVNWNPTPAPWLINNRWWWVFFYTLAAAHSETHLGSTLSLNGVSGVHVVLIGTGTAKATRPAGSPGIWNNAWWTYYVDDATNADLGVNFNIPASLAYDRDRLYTIP